MQQEGSAMLPDLHSEEHTGLLFDRRVACSATNLVSRPGRIVSAALVASILMLVAYSVAPQAVGSRGQQPRAGSSYEVKTEFASVQGKQDAKRQKGGLDEEDSSVLMSALNHLLGGLDDSAEPESSTKRVESRKEDEDEDDDDHKDEEEIKALEKAKKEDAQEEKKALKFMEMSKEDQRKALERTKQKAIEEKKKAIEEKKEEERKELELKRERERIRQQKEQLEMERRHEEQEKAERKALEKAAKLQAALERARRRKEQERQVERERQRCLEKKAKTASFRPSMYCFSLMMPFGYEPSLLAEQHKQSVGIFSCDESAVFSNSSTVLTTGDPAPVNVTLMNGSLAVVYGGRWGTAMNTGVFNRLWTEVVRLGRYRLHDWTVKVDPDAVFFPERLRNVLRRRTPMNQVRMRGLEPSEIRCGNCQLQGHEHETCAQHVQRKQSDNHTCAEALDAVAREPPHDCGCACDDFACEVPEETAMYLNNCKWGLHGPIEVFSRRGVAAYLAGLPQCVNLLKRPWGEDKFIDQCMQKLGVARENEYDLLSETACGEQPSPCGSENVAFHPFKSIESYFACFGYASKFGKGPEDLDCDEKPKLSPAEQAFM